jgi:genome maintenance exonuclease 1
MTFAYPELTTSNELGYRWYHTKGGAYPSITTVLGATKSPEAAAALENWRNSMGHEAADAFSKAATDHGTMVHLLAERGFNGEDPYAPVNGEPVPTKAVTAYRALSLKLKKVTRVYGQEMSLYSNTLQVGGRCDLAGEYKKVPAIMDFKTSGRIKGYENIEDYPLQLAFYAIAHNELFGTNINRGIILMTVGEGFPMEFSYNLDEYYEPLAKRVEQFYQLLINRTY